jgi:hypothetical protein
MRTRGTQPERVAESCPILNKYSARFQQYQAYLQRPRPDVVAMSDHARREQRLKEIVEELKSMTDWKKP